MKKLPWAEIVVGLFVLASGLAVYTYAHRDEDEIEESKRRGVAVVEALDAYQRALGEYPDSLTQLVPTYIKAIDPPVWGLQRWTYRPDSLFFQLSVAGEASGFPALYYDITIRRWVLNN